ncbi:hypothetical protein BE21_48835 [Sorangium cellulosum]|uniref:Cytochrome c domain-containing protein n=1 Tax=Sorangium cellulosum TaxID=56 RepID=A0A150TH46_SORCE|nr:hypothetical protein BE21_48835 [Sorangium cellulosum]
MHTEEPATNEARTGAQQPDHATPSDRRTRRGRTVMRRISMAACLFVAACGGADDGEPDPVAWQDMTFGERTTYMTDVVVPRMKEIFVAYDAKYETMDCTTCHGADGAARAYAMPSGQIAPLPNEEVFPEWVQDPEHPERMEWTDFMFNQVVPEMADLLQVARFDPTTMTGEFSCANCHTVEEVEPEP